MHIINDVPIILPLLPPKDPVLPATSSSTASEDIDIDLTYQEIIEDALPPGDARRWSDRLKARE